MLNKTMTVSGLLSKLRGVPSLLLVMLTTWMMSPPPLTVSAINNYEYGVRKIVGQSSPAWEYVTKTNGVLQIGVSTGLISGAGVDNQLVYSSFDSIPIFQRDTVYDRNGNKFVRVKKYYVKEEFVTQNNVNYEYLWMSETKLTGYRTPPSFIDQTTGLERDYFYLGAYEGNIDSTGKLVSKSGLFPTTSQTRSAFRNAARKNDGSGINTDSQYQLLDIAAYNDLIIVPFTIEFATTNSQSVSLGFTTGRYTAADTILYSASGVTSFVVSSTVGGYYRVGQIIAIGTSLGSSNVSGYRTILAIQSNIPTTGETTITVDGNPFNVTIGNVLWNFAWKTGATDGLGSSTATLTANTGHYPFVWRGLENPFGNLYKFIDGVKISNNVTWVATDPSEYNDIASSGGIYSIPYEPVGYTNKNINGYVSSLGYDVNYPYARHPVDATGGSTTYYSDYYHQSSGDKTVLVGGFWNTSSNAGLFYWSLNNYLMDTNVVIGSRLAAFGIQDEYFAGFNEGYNSGVEATEADIQTLINQAYLDGYQEAIDLQTAGALDSGTMMFIGFLVTFTLMGIGFLTKARLFNLLAVASSVFFITQFDNIGMIIVGVGLIIINLAYTFWGWNKGE